MWVKILLSLLVVAFCTLIGHLASGKSRARRRFFSQLFSLNEKFLSELGYARRPLPDFLRSEPKEGEFGKLLCAVWEKKEFSSELLSKEENALVSEYLSMLGRGDAGSQKGYFAAQKPALEALRTQSEKEAKEKSDLYLKLGVLAGLAIVILIV